MDNDGYGDEEHAHDNPLYAEPLLSSEEERRLFAEYARTHDADERRAIRNRLMLANMRWVRRLAKAYAYKHDLGAMTVEDLIQEGVFGLVTAIEKFRVEAGYKFSTYATSWITQAMGRAAENQSQMIREPSHVQGRRNRARRRGEEHDEPWTMVSLEAPRVAHDPESESWRDCLPAPLATPEDLAVERAPWHETLLPALRELPMREVYVLTLRYGLASGGDGMTLEEIGRSMLITRERVRQIEARALRELRKILMRTADGELATRTLTLVTETRRKESRKVAALKAAQTKRAKKQAKKTKTAA